MGKARILAEHILKHHAIVLSRVTFTSIREVELERAEKYFLLNFILSLAASLLILANELTGLSPANILTLPFRHLAIIALAIILLMSALSAVLSYLRIGLRVVVERSVQIKAKRGDRDE